MKDSPYQPSRDFWHNRRIFITGASGLVGSRLIKDLLNLGGFIVALVRDHDPMSELIRSGDIHKISVVDGCLEDFSAIERAILENEIDTVFHLAAQPIVGVAQQAPLLSFESNIRGTYHLLEACRRFPDSVKRVVVASSDKVYGDQPILPYTEEMPLKGIHPYDISKTCADLLAQSYHVSFNLPVVIARCGNIYGQGDLNWSRIIPGTIQALYHHQRPVLRSDGTYLRDYIFVEDVSRFYLALAEFLETPELGGQAFNYGSGKAVSVIEMVELIAKLMDCSEIQPIIQNTSRYEIRSQYLSNDKSTRYLHCFPQFSLEEGLKKTISWYRSFFDRREND